MLPSLRIGVTGQESIVRRIGLVTDIIGDMTPTWRGVVGPFMYEHMDRQFRTQGAYGGKPWAGYENEPFYRAYKRAVTGHLKVLRWKPGERERLYPSLTQGLDPDNILEITPTSFRFGTKVPYAADLNRGGVGPFGERYPARKIISFTDAQKNMLFVEIQRDILRRIGAEGIRAARVV